MATLNPPIAARDPATGRGGGNGPSSPDGGGGNGGRRGDDSPDYGGRLRRVRVAMIACLSAVTMIFVALTSAMIVRHGMPTYETNGTYRHEWLRLRLPMALLLVNTVVLLISSVTMELARRQAARRAALAPVRSIPGVSLGKERDLPWLGITIVLGVGFLVGQWIAWQQLAANGFYVATSASSSFFYLLTATHAVHLIGGLLVMLWAASVTWMRRPIETQRIVVDGTAWYWHFMAVLWLYVLGVIWFMR